MQRAKDGGLDVIATASLGGYPNSYPMVADVLAQYMLAVYEDLPGKRVDDASLYIEDQGRFVLAAGLGRQVAQTLAIEAFAPDQGTVVFQTLRHTDDRWGPVEKQAFVEYSPES